MSVNFRRHRDLRCELSKTGALFEREAQQRQCDEKDLAWLKRNRGDRAKHWTG
jgi:hypothetical protein